MSYMPNNAELYKETTGQPPKSTYRVQNSGNERPRGRNQANNGREGRRNETTENPTFVTFKTAPPNNSSERVLIDSGACESVVGKNTLDRALS